MAPKARRSALTERSQRARGRPASSVRVPRAASETASYAGSAGIRSRMQLQRTRDTAPEMAVRRLLHSMGFRYRVDIAPTSGLRRRADIVFKPSRVAVYVDGCFWHGCPQHGKRTPKTNEWYWPDKIARNRARDADTDERLREAGWHVIRAWEHEEPADVARRIAVVVRARRRAK